jgi:hypothetical protein
MGRVSDDESWLWTLPNRAGNDYTEFAGDADSVDRGRPHWAQSQRCPAQSLLGKYGKIE